MGRTCTQLTGFNTQHPIWFSKHCQKRFLTITGWDPAGEPLRSPTVPEGEFYL